LTGVVKRSRFIFENEILRSAAGLDDVKSMVLDATKVNTTFSGVPFRYIVPMGAVLVKSGTKVAPAFMNNGQAGQGASLGSGGAGAWVAADVVGILSRTVELIVGDTAPDSKSDTDVSVFHHGCDFNVNKLYGYGGTGNPTAVVIQAAMPTCIFR
jgi:hypothetical protein